MKRRRCIALVLLGSGALVSSQLYARGFTLCSRSPTVTLIRPLVSSRHRNLLINKSFSEHDQRQWKGRVHSLFVQFIQ